MTEKSISNSGDSHNINNSVQKNQREFDWRNKTKLTNKASENLQDSYEIVNTCIKSNKRRVGEKMQTTVTEQQ